ncbi:synaptic vesicle glycoprotein 2A-like [Condylostylus longicornis]|uniref:synaptic vesicle glycoprotein 2A-like n=1 Tax=Condylostylus longicornis TaxID=2530218 RepID=UPI00244E195E|nr:synaptic vesicle glycoprotein 2A-like [Condylostylus longicornis]
MNDKKKEKPPNFGEDLGASNRLNENDTNEMNKEFDLDPLDESDTEYELALNETFFGIFNYHILIYCGIIYAHSAIGLTSLSFVMPAAVNEFNLSSTKKGLLVAIPMIGMLFGSYFWGCLASTKGRKITLFVSLLMNGIFDILSIFMPNYISFTITRFFVGFAISGPMNICFPFLGEFQPIAYRENILCCLEFFWVLGIVILPGCSNQIA